MEPLLENVKVVELAEWAFVPSAGAILADWGAQVIKIEPPGRGDPMRGLLSTMGVQTNGFNYYVEQLNRSKRGITLDIGKPKGREIFLKLIEQADVFVTSVLEPARRRWSITYEDLRVINPRLIYARGHGQGQRGEEAYHAGFDAISYWARSGIAHLATPPGGPYIPMPGGAFGDVQAGLALAAGIAAALYRRSVTGQGGLVDVSLLGMAMWVLFPDILASNLLGMDSKQARTAGPPLNPLVGNYRTADDRYVALVMLQSDRYWPGFCRALGREDLIDDPRYCTFEQRAKHSAALFQLITEAFAARPLAEWKERLAQHGCVFSPAQTPYEVLTDPQVIANGYLPRHPAGGHLCVTASPVQYNNGMVEVRSPAPEVGQHTEEVLQELGYSWEDIVQLKDEQVI